MNGVITPPDGAAPMLVVLVNNHIIQDLIAKLHSSLCVSRYYDAKE